MSDTTPNKENEELREKIEQDARNLIESWTSAPTHAKCELVIDIHTEETQALINSEVRQALDRISDKARWDTPEADVPPSNTKEAIEAERKRYE